MHALAKQVLLEAVALGEARRAGAFPIVAIAGAQGSGKSTLAREFADASEGIVAMSLDDFYLSKQRRAQLAAREGALFRTRGVPGTHDLTLLAATLEALAAASPDTPAFLPSFDKLRDDPVPSELWRRVERAPTVVILEGWCLGALPQAADELAVPINDLEREEDADGHWRRYVNRQLEGAYASLFARMSATVFLHAPSFDVVYKWRFQQEEEALGRALTTQEQSRLETFIAHFERLTRHMLAGGRRSALDLVLDAERNVVSVARR